MEALRIEHSDHELGPFRTPPDIPHLAVISDDEPLDWSISHYSFQKDGRWIDRSFSWAYQEREHSSVLWLDCFRQAVARGWLVGCRDYQDLRHWFGHDDLLILLDSYGYVLRHYIGLDCFSMVSDDCSRQCMFTPKEAEKVRTLSVLTIAK